ncbi:MAG: HEPN domain-containing protein [Clostridium sp.]|jgi:HEPN domain-containing protein|nr:HEPN domain-containing protein [Clostridium sp.]
MVDYELIQEWFRKADNDCRVAEFLFQLHPVPMDIICFHCQQAVEKWLKGYQVSKGISEPSKIHDLNKLLKQCIEFDTRFSQLVEECSALSDFGIIPRYPDEFEVTEHDVRRAFEHATAVKNFAPLLELRGAVAGYSESGE